jgi:hypothetical protein
MIVTRNKQADNELIEILRTLDQPATVREIASFSSQTNVQIAGRITSVAIKYAYPVWRLRGHKAGSSLAQYVYSDTQPFNTVRKFPDWKLHQLRLQEILDRDLTMYHAEARAIERREASAREREGRRSLEAKQGVTLPEPKQATLIIDNISALQAGLVADAISATPKFELLEERDTDTIIFKFNGRVFVGKPVRI